jgi:hypothetical protein
MCLLYHKIHFLITGTILLLAACGEDEIEPTLSDGVLKGTTYFYETDESLGGPYPNVGPLYLGDVTVKAKGPYGTQTALTNADGEYEINNLGNGTYEIEYIKEGWGAAKYYSVQIYGNEVLSYDQRMWKYPENDMPLLTPQEYVEYWGMEFRSDLPVSTSEIPDIRAFFSKTSDVSCFKYDYTDESWGYENSGFIDYAFQMPEWYSGTVYIIFYLCDPNDTGQYDYYRAVEVFPSIDPKKHSQVIKL